MMKKLRRISAFALFVLVLLGVSFAVQAQTTGELKEAAKAAKVTPDLYNVIATGGNIAQPTPVNGLQRLNLFTMSGNSIAIEAVANSAGEAQALLQALQGLGLSKGIVFKQQVSGYLPVDKLSQLKNVAPLKFARPSYKPIHNVGSVTSQGDAAMRSDAARTTYSVTGAGVKVGVLSDSYNNLGGAPAGVASDDLPTGVEVLADLSDGSGIDEGRAMIELIHDVAPGSPQAFHTAFESALDFAQGIRDLAAAGCKIITDDVAYFAEPFFQDGPIAQAVDDVVNGGATYFSSAGNSARKSYQSAYSPTTPPATPTYEIGAHNFGGGDKFQSIVLTTGQQIIISFQWDDPFFSVSGAPGAQTDMDLLVYVNGVFEPGLSSLASNVGDDPVEIIGLSYGGSAPITIELVLAKYEGPDPSIVKWVNFGSTVPVEYDTKSSTIVGHANSRLCIGTGAAPYFNTPAFNAGLTTAIIEPFSSAGGTPIYFSTTGERLGSPSVRQKPEITAVDGGNTTFFFSDSGADPDAFPNFFGTSAAAPHAAAVAALMKEKVPSITPATILSTLQSTALDMDDPATAGFDTGFDYGTGYGFIQADRALAAITTVEPPSGFAITNVTQVSCATISAGERLLVFTPQYAGLTGQPVSFSVVNELAATTAPGPYTLRLYTDNPVITLEAVQTGTSGTASFTYNWLAVCGGSPPPSGFAITGVTTVSCETVTAGERRVTFTPQYAGLTGQPVSFGVVNELAATTAPGPYTLRLYTDNPVITLEAVQTGSSGTASFTYNWLAACGSSGARLGAALEATAELKATLYPNPVGEEFGIQVEGARGQTVRFQLSDMNGRPVVSKTVDVASDKHRELLRFNQQNTGLYLLRVSTTKQALTLKVIKQ